MSKPVINLIVNDFGYLGPLAGGEVEAAGIELKLDRRSPIRQVWEESSIAGGEISLSGYLVQLARGHKPFIGLPIFTYWAFRHRCFYVLRDAGFQRMQDLRQKRIGINAWSDTGSTWSRAALRETGVAQEEVAWWVGPIEDPGYDSWAGRPNIRIPDNVRRVPPDRTLLELLFDGAVDALVSPLTPAAYRQKNSRLARLLKDFRSAERAYYQRTGIFPAHHIIGLREDVFERAPWIAGSLYRAFNDSKNLWLSRVKRFAEATPWMLADVEETIRLMGEDWMPNGVAPNLHMMERLCVEIYEQKLTERLVEPAEIFADFTQAMAI